MKMNILQLVVVFLFASCGTNKQKLNVPQDFNTDKIVVHKNEMQKIISKDKLASIFDISINKIEEHIEDNINGDGQFTVLYSWPTGKMKKIADGKFEIEEYHSISIGSVQQMSSDDFERKIGSNEGIQEQVNQMSKQENFNKEVGVAEAKYLAAYAKARKVELLENGTAKAIWETPMNALHIYANDLAFTISTNLGEDEDYAKQKSIEITNAILNQ